MNSIVRMNIVTIFFCLLLCLVPHFVESQRCSKPWLIRIVPPSCVPVRGTTEGPVRGTTEGSGSGDTFDMTDMTQGTKSSSSASASQRQEQGKEPSSQGPKEPPTLEICDGRHWKQLIEIGRELNPWEWNLQELYEMYQEDYYEDGEEETGMSSEKKSTIALGVLSAVLFLLLLAVTVGWIVTCFVLKKKSKPANEDFQRRFDNNPTTLQMSYNSQYLNRPMQNIPQTTFYSSMGPDYEVLDNRRPQPSVSFRTPDSQGEDTTDHDYQVLEKQEKDHTYQVLEHDKGEKVGKGRTLTGTSYEVPVTFQTEKEDNVKT